jgi:hypothetical protein
MMWRRHTTTAALILVPFALYAAEPQGATTLQLRPDGPSLSTEEAKALTPQALGDALLAPGHLPVLEVVVGPQGMEPPPPPGGAVPTRVKLYLQPLLSEQSGFCQRTVATTYLQPVSWPKNPSASSGRPINLATDVAYRWIGEARGAWACNGPKYAFFIPSIEEKQRALEAVRLLAMASQAAKKGGRLGFPVSVQDKEGSEMLAYQRDHPEQPPISDFQILTNAKKALASLPIGEVTFVGPSETAFSNVLLASDFTTFRNRSARGITVFLGGDWTVGIVIVDGRIVRMRLQRAIPPPF